VKIKSRNGHDYKGKQKYRCKSCNRQSRENPVPNGYTEEEREKIMNAYQERSSLRGLKRIFNVARNTVKGFSTDPVLAFTSPDLG
jgi:transposase-like protein